jgi:hypothetical protein
MPLVCIATSRADEIVTHYLIGNSELSHAAQHSRPPAAWCPLCQGYFEPAVDREFVSRLRPNIERFLKFGHGPSIRQGKNVPHI